MFEINVWTFAIAALITALATGLGALPFFLFPNINHRWLGISNALAAGLMLGASHGLISEGIRYNPVTLLIGTLVGMLFIFISHFFIEGQEELQFGELRGSGALKAFMIIGVMTIHSFSEGIGVGVSFGGGQTLGELITIAIAIHNILEGLAISLAMIPQGTPVWRASLWGVFSSLPQPLMAIPAFLFVTFFEPFLPFGLGFAAGAMIWMVFSESNFPLISPARPRYARVKPQLGEGITVSICRKPPRPPIGWILFSWFNLHLRRYSSIVTIGGRSCSLISTGSRK